MPTLAVSDADLRDPEFQLKVKGLLSSSPTTLKMPAGVITPFGWNSYGRYRLTFQGAPNSKTIVEGTLGIQPYHCIYFYQGALNITVDGLILQNCQYSGVKLDDATNCIVRNCAFYNCKDQGVLSRVSNGLTVQYNFFDRIGSHCVYEGKEYDNQTHGIYVYGSNINILNNVLKDIWSYGIVLYPQAKGVKIYGNHCYSQQYKPYCTPICVWNSHNVRLEYNTGGWPTPNYSYKADVYTYVRYTGDTIAPDSYTFYAQDESPAQIA